MESERKPRGYWQNEQNIRDEAKKWPTRRAFAIGARGAYRRACEYNLMDDLGFPDIPVGGKLYWTFEIIKELININDWDTVQQFREQEVNAYQSALRSGILKSFELIDLPKAGCGFGRSGYIKMSQNKHNGKATFYIYHFWDNIESFYTYGITTQKANLRYSGKDIYKRKLLYEYTADVEFIWDFEKFFQREVHSYKYKPLQKIPGLSNESFNNIPKNINKL